MRTLTFLALVLALAAYGGRAIYRDATQSLPPAVEPVERKQKPQRKPHRPFGDVSKQFRRIP